MSQRHAVVNDITDIIENVIVWDGKPGWTPPEGSTAHPSPEGIFSPGWRWNNGSPVKTEEEPPVTAPVSREAQLLAAKIGEMELARVSLESRLEETEARAVAAETERDSFLIGQPLKAVV